VRSRVVGESRGLGERLGERLVEILGESRCGRSLAKARRTGGTPGGGFFGPTHGDKAEGACRDRTSKKSEVRNAVPGKGRVRHGARPACFCRRAGAKAAKSAIEETWMRSETALRRGTIYGSESNGTEIFPLTCAWKSIRSKRRFRKNRPLSSLVVFRVDQVNREARKAFCGAAGDA
jgi:hypothetical protein